MRPWGRLLAGIGVAFITMVPSVAGAQTTQPEPTPAPEARPGLTTPFLRPLGPFVSPPSTPGQFSTIRPALGSPQAGGQRGGLIFTPSVSVDEEYNDNVFSDNRDKRADFITAISPGLALSYETPIYRLAGAYSFTSLVYANESQLNTARGRELLTFDALYRATQRVTLTLVETYVKSESPSSALVTGIATPGLTETKSNTVTTGVRWEVTPLTDVHASATWTRQTFGSSTGTATGATGASLNDSDAYILDTGVDRELTKRLKGTVGYQYRYFDVAASPVTQTHTPSLGLTYEFTRTVTGSVSAGPQFVIENGDLSVGMAAHADLTRRFAWGSAGLSFDRNTTTSGGLAGTATTTSFGGQVDVTTLKRGLTLGFAPRYGETESDDGRVDVKIITLQLQGSYQVTPWLTVHGGYSFLQQRTSGTAAATDLDQNRVFVGVQIGYPVRFD